MMTYPYELRQEQGSKVPYQIFQVCSILILGKKLRFSNNLFLLSLLLLGLGSVTTSQSLAQTAATRKRLPPPPSVPSQSNSFQPIAPSSPQKSRYIPVQPPSTPNSASSVREYTFQAPSAPRHPGKPQPVVTNTPPNSVTSGQSRGLYRVEVRGKTQDILAKVKKVEPLAFIRAKDGIIQAGIFDNQRQANARRQQLAKQGLSAQVVSKNYRSDVPARMSFNQ
jgi:cell division protein FtsN